MMSKTKSERIAELEARVAMLESKRASKSEHALDAAAYLNPFTTKPVEWKGKIYDEGYRGKSFYVTSDGDVSEGYASSRCIKQGVEFYDRESAELFVKQREIRHRLDGFCRELCGGHDGDFSYLHRDVDGAINGWSRIQSDYKIPPGAYCIDEVKEAFTPDELKLVLGGFGVKIRYREHKRLFRRSLLVLQVSYTRDDTHNEYAPPSAQKVNEYWADATVEDLCSIKLSLALGGEL